VRDLNPRFPI